MRPEAVLDSVWTLVGEHTRLQSHAASSAEVKALRSRQRKIPRESVPEAIEAWIDRHRDVLEVNRGSSDGALDRVIEAVGPLHPLHRDLVDHFGFLEIRVARSHWPFDVHTDGIRVIGWAPDHRWCHAPALTAIHREYYAGVLAKEYVTEDDKKAAESAQPLVPMLTTLEGLRDQWAAGPRKIQWIENGNQDRTGHLDDALASHPRFGPAYALLARLRVLEQRLANIAAARELETKCNALTRTEFDRLGLLRLLDDPELRIRPAVFKVGGGGHGVLMKRVLEARPEGKEFRTDAVQEAKARALRERMHMVTIGHSGLTATAEYNWGGHEVTLHELGFVMGELRWAKTLWDDPSQPEFDTQIETMPADVAELLSRARADEANVARRMTEAGKLPVELRVQCVGRVLPRVEWSVAATPSATFWKLGQRNGRAIRYTSCPLADLSEARLEKQLAMFDRPGLQVSPDFTAAEQAQTTRSAMAISTEVLAALQELEEESATALWRRIAQSRPIAPSESAFALRTHERWVDAHASQPHEWKTFAWLDVNFAVRRSDDPTGDLQQLDWSRRDLRRLDLAGTMLTAAKLVHVLAAEVSFAKAALNHACAIDSDMQSARFDGADLRGSDFSRTDFTGASFRDADCRGTDFERCVLTGCDFTGAALEGAKFGGATDPPPTG